MCGAAGGGLVTGVNSWRDGAEQTQAERGGCSEDYGSARWKRAAGEGLEGKGRGSRIYQLFRYALQLSVIFHWIV